MANRRIRAAILESGLKLWQVADLIGMRETSLSRKLRYELPDDEQKRICKLINEYVEKGGKDHLSMLKEQREIVLCKDCKHRPNFDLEFPDERCPCKCSGDEYYSWYPDDNWFCGNGERKE